MGQKEFFRKINDETRLRVLIVTEKGHVKRFLAQLEVLLGESWTPVCRYDTHHGFAHQDILHPDGRADKIRLVARDFNESLHMAFADLVTNWEHYVEGYLEKQ